MRRRRALIPLLVAILAISLSAVVTAPPAQAGTGYHHVTLSWLRANMPGFAVGPSAPTGYGRSKLTGFPLACPDCAWYRISRGYTNSQPTSPLSVAKTPATAAAAARRICWPWDNWLTSGCSIWDDVGTWNWWAVLHNWNFNPVDDRSTIDRIWQCFNGVYDGIVIGAYGKEQIGLLMEMGDGVKITPFGFAYATIQGCTVQLWLHN
jgi:hypothetical protein